MRVSGLMLSASLLSAPVLAAAQPVSGLYIGAGAGLNGMVRERNRITGRDVQTYTPNVATPQRPGVVSANLNHDDSYGFNEDEAASLGAAAVASIGYGLGNGLRIEAEGDYRYNAPGNLAATPHTREQKFGGMANLLYDLPFALGPLTPYIGAGIGYMHADRPEPIPSSGSFAYQGIAGVSYPLPFAPRLALTLEYRFMGLDAARQTSTSSATFTSAGPFGGTSANTNSTTYKSYNDFNHAIMFGVRYAFDAPAAPALPAPPLPVATTPAQRTYLVFFDWDRADLTDRARQIVAQAAQASTRTQVTRIEVDGHTDLSGTARYNLGLSQRRAQAVAAELLRDGVPRAAIAIQGFGETHPLVPTAAGVREPQNRRVEIILR